MGVFLESREIAPENVTGNVDYLKGNIFQKMTATFQVRCETWVQLATNRSINIGDQNFKTNDWITDYSRGNAFAEFNVGDTLVIENTNVIANNRSYIIREKIDDRSIRVYDNLGVPTNLIVDTALVGRLNLDQESLGVTFDFGLPENDDPTTFTSKVDGNLMRYEYGTLAAIPSSATSMEAIGRKSWQIGEARVANITQGADRDNYRYIFQVEQDFFIHPFYKHTQLISLLDNQPPPYFDRDNCLKHTFRFRGYRTLQDPNVYQEGIFDDKEGNTGWFDEEYNGGNRDWNVTNLSYNNSIETIDRYGTTNITFDIENIGLNDVAHATLNFIMLPEASSDYQNINTLMQENYCFDRAAQTPGGGAVNGEEFGTGFQVITDYTVTVNGVGPGGSVTCDLDIDFGADVLAKIDAYKDKYFAIAVYCVSSLQTAELANYTTLLVDVNQIKVLIPDNVLTVTNEILYHDQNDNTFVNTSGIVKVEDELTMYSLVKVNQATFTDLQINKVNLQIVAKKTGEEVVILDQELDFSQLTDVGTIRYINQVSQNSLNVSASEIRKEIKAFRDIGQDAAPVFAYRFQYPLMYRWEYWESLNIATLPADWLDTAEQFNGYNNNWVRIAQLTGWATYYRLSIEVETQNTVKVIDNDFELIEKDYDANPDWINETIEIYDGATNLTVSGQPYAFDKRNTTVKMSFEYNPTLTFGASDVFMVARIIPVEGGTYITSESFSSVWNRDAVSLFTSANGLIDISLVGKVFTGEFEIDASKLPKGVRAFTISGSIMQKNV